MFRLNGFWTWTSPAAGPIRMICASIEVNPRISGDHGMGTGISGVASTAVSINGTLQVKEC